MTKIRKPPHETYIANSTPSPANTLPTTTPQHGKYKVEEIPINLIDVDEQLIRDHAVDDDIGELAESIAAVDLLQFPGVLAKDAGRYQLAWGRRRIEAVKRLGQTTIPCRIYEGQVTEVKALALVENNQRRQNTIKEECDCVDYLTTRRNLSPDQVAGVLGRTRSWVLVRLAIPNFPGDCREAVLSGTIPLGHAEEIAVLEDDAQRAYILNQTVYQKLPLSEVRQLVRVARSTPNISEAVEIGVLEANTPTLNQPLMMPCASCNKPTNISDLILIRVHKNGCTTSDENQPGTEYQATKEQ